MDDLEIMRISQGLDLKEEDFENIQVELNEFEINKTKKILRERIKKDSINSRYNKRSVKRLSVAALALAFISISIILLSKPAFAENIKLLDTVYEKLGYYKEYKDFSEMVGQTQENNGYSFTIDKVVVTPTKAVVAIRVNSKNVLDKNKETSLLSNLTIMMDFPENQPKSGSGGQHVEYIDEHNALLVNEEEIQGGTFKKRGDFKLHIHSFGLDGVEKVSADFNFKVDFSKSFAMVMNTRIDKMLQFGDEKIYLKDMQSTVLGTIIRFTTADLEKCGKFLIEVDGSVYRFINWGTSDDGGHAFIKELTYDKVKSAKSIKVIPIYIENIDENPQDLNNDDIEITEAMNLPQKLGLLKESQGEVYRVDKTENKIRVYYCNGEKTLAELGYIYIYGEDENDFALSTIGKDPNRKDGYYIEREIQGNKKYYIRKTRSGLTMKTGDGINIK
ncbi:DUF4179 domain-containing protein [Clostridium sp. 'White wine YQ']|uniref:DUF4179 domain-containing protein n=1 Tax=Clostridium sp. 'White wine YQ' TaxID=3027474 RepID=UPI0023672422|nr:DUF4179 domain-containing protein [Clostridium sp. 'White wine YQ']MDD7793159.1 DUF4179 domain-containing protein [Clostridium sp. 'White wine YQ']